jgi:hypothetical protein
MWRDPARSGRATQEKKTVMRNDLPPRYALAAMAVCLVLLVPEPASAETPLRADQQRTISSSGLHAPSFVRNHFIAT